MHTVLPCCRQREKYWGAVSECEEVSCVIKLETECKEEKGLAHLVNILAASVSGISNHRYCLNIQRKLQRYTQFLSTNH